jgi:hypothetical protein
MLFIGSFNINYLTLNPVNIMVDQHCKIIIKNFGLAEEFEEEIDKVELNKFLGKLTPYSPP